MAANLWSYRYRHSWYGDRRFGFAGSWKQLALPYYGAWLASAIIGAAGLGVGAALDAAPAGGAPAPVFYGPVAIAALLIGLLVLAYQARELTSMYSSVRLGGAALTMRVRARDLAGQYGLFGLGLVVSYVFLAMGGFLVLAILAADAFAGGQFDIAVFMQHLQQSFMVLLAIVFGYLLLLGAFTLMAELFLGLGFWKLIAQGASITGLDSLDNVRARGEDRALAGEGLADALNVGAY
jgi:hypothetical protein